MASGSSPLLETWDARLTTSGRIRDDLGTHDYPSIDAEARRIARALLAAYTPSSRNASSASTASRVTSLAGERVALLAPAGAEFVAAFFGILMAGGCVVLLSPLHPAAESIYVCTDARVKTILVGRGMAEKAAAADRSSAGVVVGCAASASSTASALARSASPSPSTTTPILAMSASPGGKAACAPTPRTASGVVLRTWQTRNSVAKSGSRASLT